MVFSETLFLFSYANKIAATVLGIISSLEFVTSREQKTG
jgi:hypothetical protein